MRRRNIPLAVGLTLLAGLLILLLLPEVIPLRDPQMATLVAEVGKGVRTPPFFPGEAGFVLGSDSLGRDYLSRLIYGARFTLGLAAAVSLLRGLIAIPLGLAAGWRGGWLRGVTSALSAAFGSIPALVMVALALTALRATVYDPIVWVGVYIAAVVLAGFPRMTEHIARRTREVAAMPHMEAAVAVGAPPRRLLGRHVFPLVADDLLMMMASEMAWSLLLIGQLAIFGIYVGGSGFLPGMTGLPEKIAEYWPEWAAMMGVTRHAVISRAWLPLLPGLALTLTAVCFHMLAEGLRLRQVRR